MSIVGTITRKIKRIPFVQKKDVRRLHLPQDADGITYRLFTEVDSVKELTQLINKAYGIYKTAGLDFMGLDQDEDETKKRLRHAYTIIAIEKGNILGTISYKAPWECRGTTWFNQPGVAKFNQLAVDPDHQAKGIAKKLMEIVEHIAFMQGADEMALDTAEGAKILVSYYKRLGYRFIDFHEWSFTNYRSVILSKNLTISQTI